MVKRRRHRFWSSLLCVLIIGAFVASLPVAEPLRRKSAIGAHKLGWNLLQHPRVVETVVDKNWRYPGNWGYPDWYVRWIQFHNSSLEAMGACQRISIPITRADADLVKATGRINPVPGGAYWLEWIKQEDGSYMMSVLVSTKRLPDWQAFAVAIRNGERKIAGD